MSGKAVSDLVMTLIDVGLAQRSPEATARSLYTALEALGIKAIYARAYQGSAPGRPDQVFARIAPAGLGGMYADPRFYEHNPLSRDTRWRIHPVRWSDLAWRKGPEQWIRESMRDCGCPDGIAIPCHGPGGSFGVMSLAFDRLDQIAPDERRAIEVAALVLYGHMRSFGATPVTPRLSQRERDCLAFIADGLSDPEISARLNLSTSTIATHVSHARAKLGARTRAQAVALFLLNGSCE